jgi:hypothetical protein
LLKNAIKEGMMPVTTAKSGRALAQERRTAAAKTGRHAPAAVAPQRSPAQAATTSSPSSPLDALCQRLDAGEAFGSETPSVRELCRLRRQAVSQNGKSAVKTIHRPIEALDFHNDVPEKNTEKVLDDFCSQAETEQGAFGSDLHDVRSFCRQRRQALSQNGKAALPAAKNVQAANAQFAKHRMSATRMAVMQGVYCAPEDQSCREAAKQLRQRRAINGRGSATTDQRPSGRMRPKSLELPEKVEVGTTLSGQFVTGTQVERSEKVTGNERGSCRSQVTGTEYLGQEQFQQFCDSKPAPNPPKVRQSQTSLGQTVTGAEPVPAKVQVTGGESGSCRTITGTEYLGSERFAQFCEGRGFLPRVEKVVESQSPRKGLKITGSDEARHRPISGVAAGAERTITGTQYADMHRARLTINGAEKVQTTHTFSGRSISGSVVDRSGKVTGNETGSCRGITGTEYLSQEHYQNFCETVPKSAPHRVSVMPTRHGQSISGVSVERSEKVTGNEPGSCSAVTGSQYSETTLCDRRSVKSHSMKTLSGREVSGTAVASRPKLTGDARGGCLPVTGNEYYGQEHYANCPSTPMPRPEKVGISQTKTGQLVTGAMLERSALVTGNEAGSARPISGTPYGAVPAPVTVAPKTTAVVVSHALPLHTEAAEEAEKTPAVPTATVLTEAAMPMPAMASRRWQRSSARITGSAFAASEKITGPVNLANSLVSGTPEFRYREDRPLPTPMPVSLLQQQLNIAQQDQTLPAADQVTGEGRTNGESTEKRITGDNWSRNSRVTGTEGRWSQGRNPTYRSNAATREVPAVGAFANKGREKRQPETNPKITGSSAGVSSKGPVITLSGGARG